MNVATLVAVAGLGAVFGAAYLFAPDPPAPRPGYQVAVVTPQPYVRVTVAEAMRELAPRETTATMPFVLTWWATTGAACERSVDLPIQWKVNLEERLDFTLAMQGRAPVGEQVTLHMEEWPGNWTLLTGWGVEMGFFPSREACEGVVRRMRAGSR